MAIKNLRKSMGLITPTQKRRPPISPFSPDPGMHGARGKNQRHQKGRHSRPEPKHARVALNQDLRAFALLYRLEREMMEPDPAMGEIVVGKTLKDPEALRGVALFLILDLGCRAIDSGLGLDLNHLKCRVSDPNPIMSAHPGEAPFFSG